MTAGRVLLLGALFIPALLLVLGAWHTRRFEASAERRFPPLGPMATAGGTRWHFTDRGHGPTVILLHGAGSNLRDFEHSLVPLLAERHRVINIDRPGAGHSPAPERWMNPREQALAILELVRERGAQRAVWVGHSWAGSVVMAALLEAPERVPGGVLLAGAAYPWTGGVDLSYRFPGWPLVGPLLSATLAVPAGTLLLDRGISSAFAPDPPPPDYAQRTGVELYLRPSQFRSTARDVRLLSDFLLGQSPRYGALRQPLTVIHGDADTIVPAWNHADRLERLLPRARIVRLPGTGHQPQHVATELVAAEITRLVERTLTAPP